VHVFNRFPLWGVVVFFSVCLFSLFFHSVLLSPQLCLFFYSKIIPRSLSFCGGVSVVLIQKICSLNCSLFKKNDACSLSSPGLTALHLPLCDGSRGLSLARQRLVEYINAHCLLRLGPAVPVGRFLPRPWIHSPLFSTYSYHYFVLSQSSPH